MPQDWDVRTGTVYPGTFRKAKGLYHVTLSTEVVVVVMRRRNGEDGVVGLC